MIFSLIVSLLVYGLVNPFPIARFIRAAGIEDRGHTCYFEHERRSPYEVGDRPERSVVSTNCNNNVWRSFETLMKQQMGLNNAEFVNAADAVLIRGASEFVGMKIRNVEPKHLFDLDWENIEEVEKWKDKYICDNHYNELIHMWPNKQFKHIIRKTYGVACSFVDTVAPFHKTVVKEGHPRHVTRDESFAFLVNHNQLIHPGIPICWRHKQYLKRIAAQEVVQRSNHRIMPEPESGDFGLSPDSSLNEVAMEDVCAAYEPLTSDTSPDVPSTDPDIFVNQNTINSFFDFVKTTNENRLGSKKPFSKLEARTKRKKAHAVKNLFDTVYQIVAQQDKDELKSMVKDVSSAPDWATRTSKAVDKLLKRVALDFTAATNTLQKNAALQYVARAFSLDALRKYIPGLSNFYFTKARKSSKKERKPYDPKKRLSREKVNLFIEFIVSPAITVGLPWGEIKSKTTDGKIIEIPSALRLHRNYEVINQYGTYLVETGQQNMNMSLSSYERILKACTAKRRVSISCVDTFAANAADAVDSYVEMIEDLENNYKISKQWAADLVHRIYLAKNYLLGDYPC